MSRRRPRVRLLVAAAAVVAVVSAGRPAPAAAQVFFATRPDPPFMVGPLLIRAQVARQTDAVPVDVFFGLSVPPGRSAGEPQDLYVLWPGAITGTPSLGRPERALARYVEERGFSVIEEGRVPLGARNLFGARATPEEPVAGGAPYVTFVRENTPMGMSAAATWIRVPWSPRLVNRLWITRLHLAPRGLAKEEKTSWLDRTFRGRRYTVSVSFQDLRSRSLFPMYLEHRDRMVRLGEDPSQLVVTFADADHLHIDQVFPASASRKLSETAERTEVVSDYLDRAQGLTPQVLTVRFGYFSGLQSWGAVVIPLAFFVLGNILSPWLVALVRRLGGAVAARVHVGRPHAAPPGRARGVVIPRDRLAAVVPGQTRYDEVLALCGADADEIERSAAPGRRTLIYRGKRLVPRPRRTFGWLATVDRWDLEDHEVEIEVENGVVADVQSRVRRTRLPAPAGV
jgi:hypothetical protein